MSLPTDGEVAFRRTRDLPVEETVESEALKDWDTQLRSTIASGAGIRMMNTRGRTGR